VTSTCRTEAVTERRHYMGGPPRAVDVEVPFDWEEWRYRCGHHRLSLQGQLCEAHLARRSYREDPTVKSETLGTSRTCRDDPADGGDSRGAPVIADEDVEIEGRVPSLSPALSAITNDLALAEPLDASCSERTPLLA